MMIDEHGAKIDLVLTDVVMPKVGGPELIARLRETSPGSKVLYMSGYTDRTVPLEQDAGAAFIQKPFTPLQLGQKLREILYPEQPEAPQSSVRRMNRLRFSVCLIPGSIRLTEWSYADSARRCRFRNRKCAVI